MQRALKNALKIALVIAPILMSASNASANPQPMKDSYIGAGVAAGVTNGGQEGDAANTGGSIQGRYAIPNAPVSVRGAVFFSNETAAIMPMVSYDLAVTNNANVYAGVGYAFHESDGAPTPLGNKDSVVLTTGVEAKVTRDIVIFSDAKVGINAYENSPASAVSVQVGGGYRF